MSRRRSGPVPMLPEHSQQIRTRAKRRSRLNFSEFTNWANQTFGTNYSLFQVSACLGRAGFIQNS